jgi:pimeloyl-ACP methyl ester carboxylesterase
MIFSIKPANGLSNRPEQPHCRVAVGGTVNALTVCAGIGHFVTAITPDEASDQVDDLLKSLKLPVLVTHGSEDKNSNLIAAEYTAKMIPGAKLSVYQGIGHSPFFEDAPRFNAELAAFVRSAQKGN